MYRKMASEIGSSLKQVLQRIDAAVAKRSKDLPNIPPRLVAVSKTKPVEDIIAAYNYGQRHFGENYNYLYLWELMFAFLVGQSILEKVAELEEKSKSEAILESCKDIKWHFIGNLQRNKVNKVTGVPNLFMVETVHTEKLAQTLNKSWEKLKKPERLKVMIQVNTSEEESKNGCDIQDAEKLIDCITNECPQLELKGIMTIGVMSHDLSKGANPDFQRLLQCRENICKAKNIELKDLELSMGMSADYEHAIEQGSTNIRVGSTIFGQRYYPNKNSTTNPLGQTDSAASTSLGETDSTNSVSKTNSETVNKTDNLEDETIQVQQLTLQN